MIILGVDPGYAILGYGIIEAENRRLRPVDYGVIETKAGEPFPERLEKLYLGMRQLVGIYRPEHIVFEELFFYRNTTTALPVPHIVLQPVDQAAECSSALAEKGRQLLTMCPKFAEP